MGKMGALNTKSGKGSLHPNGGPLYISMFFKEIFPVRPMIWEALVLSAIVRQFTC
jgi:hypothetical protein